MLDEMTTALPTLDGDFEDGRRVRESAQRLFGRLNPPVRDPEIPEDAPPLAVYDWEIAKDTEIPIEAVRLALRLLDRRALVVGVVNQEQRVLALVNDIALS